MYKAAIVYVGSQDSIAFIYDSNNLLTKVLEYYKTSITPYVQTYESDFGYDNGKLNKIRKIDLQRGYMTIDSVIYDSGNRFLNDYKFLYDNTGKMYQVDTMTFLYTSDNQLDKIVYRYSSDKYTSTNGNITKVENTESLIVHTYTFDNNINPYKGNPYFFMKEEFYNSNNILQNEYSDPDPTNTYAYTYTYVYDNIGYPVKMIQSWGGYAYTQQIYYK